MNNVVIGSILALGLMVLFFIIGYALGSESGRFQGMTEVYREFYKKKKEKNGGSKS